MQNNILRERIRGAGLTVAEIAVELGVNPATVYRKLASPGSFSVGEAHKLVELLHLTHEEAVSIFLS